MGRFDPENPERTVRLDYGPRDGGRFRGPGNNVDCVAVADGDRGMGARFEVGFVPGDEGGRLDEIDVRGSELRDDPSVRFSVRCSVYRWRDTGWARSLWLQRWWRGRADEAHQRSRTHNRDRTEA